LFLGSVSSALLPLSLERRTPAQAREQDHGRINPPIPVPDVRVVLHDGATTRLPALVRHHATALQVMFTACRTTCPIQGAIFARVQGLISDQVVRGVQLVSLSVDPRADTPRALAAWLERFHAGPGWIAAAPEVKDVDRIRAFAGRGRSATDNHSTQVQIVNREGQLVWRTSELPEAEEVATILRRM
jgi:protein SCO1/2